MQEFQDTAQADQPPLGQSNKSEGEKDKGLRTTSVTPEPTKSPGDVKGASPPPVEDEFELLSKRFAALKKR